MFFCFLKRTRLFDFDPEKIGCIISDIVADRKYKESFLVGDVDTKLQMKTRRATFQESSK